MIKKNNEKKNIKELKKIKIIKKRDYFSILI
jgi:hypothetical protein